MDTTVAGPSGDDAPQHGPATGETTPNSPTPPTQNIPHLSDLLAVAECQQQLLQLDRRWEMERRQYLIISRRHPTGEIPKHATAWGFLVVGALFASGLIWLTIRIGPLALLLFSPITCLTGIILWTGVTQFTKASKYKKALARYQAQRDAIRPTPASPADDGAPLDSAAETQRLMDRVSEVCYQVALARLDREWEIEQQTHMIFSRRGGQYLPDRQQAYYAVLAAMLTGLFLIFTGGPSIIRYFGVLFVLLGPAFGIHMYNLAIQYEKALKAYQARRESLKPEQFRP